MITIHSSKQIDVTPEMAGDWLQHNIFARQRAMRPRHRDALVQETRIHVSDPDLEILIKGTPYKGLKAA
ncbi:MAG: hypothetical protein HQL59_06330 [Magnetococcales bacterium]|nr:hypothetical protein [Magnetococcales bacterium]